MSGNKQCPLCGTQIEKGENVCLECRDHMDHHYTTDFSTKKTTPTLPSSKPEVEPIYSQPQNNTVEAEPSKEPTKARPKISKGIMFLIIGSAILVIIGIIGALNIARTRESNERQEMFWVQCVEENTPLAYSKYLVRYPEGLFVEEAENRIKASREAEIAAWEKLRKSSDINAFYAYLSEHPKTPHLEQILVIMDSLSWKATLKDNTEGAYKAYLENVDLGNLSGAHKSEAKEKYDYLSQIVVLSDAALKNVKLDLTDFFKKLSENKPRELLKEFAPKAFYYTEKMNSTDIVSSITKEYTDKKIKKITYTLQPESLFAKQDNKGVIFVELTVSKEIVYSVKKQKNDNLKQNLLLELSEDKLVQSIKVKNGK